MLPTRGRSLIRTGFDSEEPSAGSNQDTALDSVVGLIVIEPWRQRSVGRSPEHDQNRLSGRHSILISAEVRTE